MPAEATQAMVGIARHDTDVLEGLLQARVQIQEASGLDPKTYALINIAALIGMDAAPASYVWQVGLAIEAGASPEEILGVLMAVNPVVGNARTVAAAPELALALGVDLEVLGAD